MLVCGVIDNGSLLLAPALATLLQVRRFLIENVEVAKLRERQALVDLEGFDLDQETSLQGVFGVSGSTWESCPWRWQLSCKLCVRVLGRKRLPCISSCCAAAARCVVF